MFYEIYKSIETALAPVPRLKGVQWFNMQYESVIAITPVAFVEFPELNTPDHASKDITRIPYRVRIHIVSKVIGGQDGSINGTAIKDNETLALAVKTALSAIKPTGSNALRFAGWQNWQRQNGFMITFVDFTARIEQA